MLATQGRTCKTKVRSSQKSGRSKRNRKSKVANSNLIILITYNKY